MAVRNDQVPQEDRMRVVDWAEQHDVSIAFLYRVLNGRETSARVQGAVDAFVEEQLGHFRRHRQAA